MNNKGFTLVELLMSFVLSMIIVMLLFQLIINLKDVYVNSVIKTDLLNKQNLMTNKINSDFLDLQVLSVSNCSDGSLCINFSFSNGSEKKLIVDDSNESLTYDDYVVKYDNGTYISGISVTNSTFGNINQYNKILNVKVDVSNDTFVDDDFGVNVVYMYDGNSILNSVSDYYSDFDLSFDSVDYIESNGSQFINTNYMAKTNTEIQFDVEFIENGFTNTLLSGGNITILGNDRESENVFTFNTGSGATMKDVIYYWVDTYSSQQYSKRYQSVLGRSVFDVKSGLVTFQDENFEIGTKTGNDTANMVLLGGYTSSAGKVISFNRFDTRIYGFKIFEGDTLVKDMVPVRRKSDGVAGLYDRVSKVFYRSSSGVDFVSDYDFSSEYSKIDYIYSNGNQYIDTNYIAKTNTEIRLDMEFIENSNINSTSAMNTFIGRNSSDNHDSIFTANFGGNADQDKRIYYWVDKQYNYGAQVQSSLYSSVLGRSVMSLKSGLASFQGVDLTLSTKTADCTEKMLLLASYYTAEPAGIYAFNRYDVKVYGFRILEVGTVIRDMVPARRNSDGVIGLYDRVGKVFYRSSSGIDFIYNES